MMLVKKKGNFYRAVIKLLGILFFALRRFTPTRSGFSRFAGAHVGVALLAKPLPFVELRQHAPAFPGLPGPMLASPSSQSPYPSPNRANTPWVFPICRRTCWRRPLRKAFDLRRATPTRPGFSRPAGAHVGADLLAKPLSFAEPRQHAPDFSGLPGPMLASTSSQSHCLSSSHANTPWFFLICRRLCWRRPPRKAFALRRATPTPKSIESEICVIQNERKTALPISSRSFFTKIRSCRNYSAITVPTQALPVHAALPSSVSK